VLNPGTQVHLMSQEQGARFEPCAAGRQDSALLRSGRWIHRLFVRNTTSATTEHRAPNPHEWSANSPVIVAAALPNSTIERPPQIFASSFAGRLRLPAAPQLHNRLVQELQSLSLQKTYKGSVGNDSATAPGPTTVLDERSERSYCGTGDPISGGKTKCSNSKVRKDGESGCALVL
jgi:hypothetical protein